MSFDSYRGTNPSIAQIAERLADYQRGDILPLLHNNRIQTYRVLETSGYNLSSSKTFLRARPAFDRGDELTITAQDVHDGRADLHRDPAYLEDKERALFVRQEHNAQIASGADRALHNAAVQVVGHLAVNAEGTKVVLTGDRGHQERMRIFTAAAENAASSHKPGTRIHQRFPVMELQDPHAVGVPRVRPFEGNLRELSKDDLQRFIINRASRAIRHFTRFDETTQSFTRVWPSLTDPHLILNVNEVNKGLHELRHRQLSPLHPSPPLEHPVAAMNVYFRISDGLSR